MNKSTLCKTVALAFILLLVVNCAFAKEVIPRADAVFSSAKIVLSSRMNASFAAQTKSLKSEIKVTECILQIKNGSEWTDDTDLTPPSKIATNTTRYAASKVYSDACTSGNTYRIKAVYNADGHTITAYSNSVSY